MRATEVNTPIYPRQAIEFHDLDKKTVLEILRLREPLFVTAGGGARRQLNYLEKYIRQLGCRGLLLERHYIDRDYMEEHSVFYSKSLPTYSNFCRRIHFFTLNRAQLRREIKHLQEIVASSSSVEETELATREFSRSFYRGFSVIKPLPGCPVGRTVLSCLPKESSEGFIRRFDCSCDYDVHLLGLRLRVRGLAFQQQDSGVSACATTALWTSLQRARDLEQSGAVTPAQITLRASQFNLSTGRPMPSEGLSLEQMSQAIQSLGYSPNVHLVSSFEIARALLYSCELSGTSAVLLLSDPKRAIHHTVALTGLAVATSVALSDKTVGDESSTLVGLYVHDDRYGPNLEATIRPQRGRVSLKFAEEGRRWNLTHILIPLHPKIRLSFAGLYSAATTLAESVFDVVVTRMAWSFRTVRSHLYVEELLRGLGGIRLAPSLFGRVPLSRYVSVVGFRNPKVGSFDVLLDTTSTERNLNCLAIIQLEESSAHPGLTSQIAKQFCCPLIK